MIFNHVEYILFADISQWIIFYQIGKQFFGKLLNFFSCVISKKIRNKRYFHKRNWNIDLAFKFNNSFNLATSNLCNIFFKIIMSNGKLLWYNLFYDEYTQYTNGTFLLNCFRKNDKVLCVLHGLRAVALSLLASGLSRGLRIFLLVVLVLEILWTTFLRWLIAFAHRAAFLESNVLFNTCLQLAALSLIFSARGFHIWDWTNKAEEMCNTMHNMRIIIKRVNGVRYFPHLKKGKIYENVYSYRC